MAKVKTTIDELRGLTKDLQTLERELKGRIKLRGMDFYTPNRIQYDAHRSTAKTIAIVKGNRMGGSTWGAMEVAFHVTKQYPPWYPEERKFTGAIKIRIATDKYAKIDNVIEPKLKDFIPHDHFVRTRRSPQGYATKIIFKDGTTIEFLTMEQDSMAFEGQDLDLFWGDEPVEKIRYIATARGLIDRSGQTILTFTPLIEPWMKEDIVDKADGKNIEVFYGNTRDNKFDIKGNPILSEEDIARFEATLDEDTRKTRIEGKFFHLKGQVYKEFGDVHLLNDFKYEPLYPVYCVLDPHDRQPHWLIWAMIDRCDDITIIHESAYDGTVRQLAAHILTTEKYFHWNITKRLIDPNFGMKRLITNGRTVIQDLAGYNVSFTEANDHKDTGRMKVKSYLHYNRNKPVDLNNRPKLYFVRDRVPLTIRAMRNYQYDEWKGADRDAKEDVKQKDTHGPDCFAAGTEVLTDKGWKDFSELSINNLLMTSTGEYQPCSDVISYKHSGDMVRINSPHIDLLVTPNHNMLVDRSRKGNISFCKAGDLKTTHRIPRVSDSFKTQFNGTITIPPIWTEDNRKWENERHISSEVWADFIGWYVSEGSATGTKNGKIQIPGRGYQVIISQTIKKNQDKIANLLDRLPWKWKLNNDRNFIISNKQLWNKLYYLGNSYNKRIPRDVMNLDVNCLKILWKSLVDGDGWITNKKGNRKENVCYATVSKKLADDIQELLLKLGMASSITTREAKSYCIKNRFGNNTVKQYHIYPNFNKFAVVRDSNGNSKISYEKYDGMVYCATVPNHTLVIRNNNKTLLTGNCIRYLCMSEPTYSIPVPYQPNVQEAYY